MDFSGVEQFIETPVKRYSSGMYVRLAFAVAAHLEPEILLVDEVLAVGDAAFQKKCVGKMGDVAQEGRTVLFVSHNMIAVKNLCDNVAFIDKGRILEIGSPDRVIGNYISTEAYNVEEIHELAGISDRFGNGLLKFASWWIKDKNYNKNNVVSCGSETSIFIKYEIDKGAEKSVGDVSLTVIIYDMGGQPIIGGSTYYSNSNFKNIPDTGVFECNLGKLILMPGNHYLAIRCAIKGEEADYIRNAGTFEVIPSDFFGTGRFPSALHGAVLIEPKWKVF